MRIILCCCLFALSLSAVTPYDTSIRPSAADGELPINRGSVALWQTLKKLHTRASLLMVTAHPDDEDGGMLTYESRGIGAQVTLLTLNRGEGGANVMSPHFFDALGLLRTQELLAAGRFYGVDQYWTRVIDYGFSKTMDESIQHWTRDRVLYDAVRVVRTVRPLVITSVFVGGPTDGHGNHQTAGAMAQAVFIAAGDPNVFPDQIKAGLRPWSPVKDYARVPIFGHLDKPLSANVEVPEGTYDPVLGASYVQISREGLGYQKSQNGGPNIPEAGQFTTEYHLFASAMRVPEKESSFFHGIDTSLAGIASLAKGGDSSFLQSGLQKINAAVEEATGQFSAARPERCAPALAKGLKETVALIDAVKHSNLSEDSQYDVLHELEVKRTQFNNGLIEALGISLESTVAPAEEPDPRFAEYLGRPDTFQMVIPGQSFGVHVRVNNGSATAAKLENVSVQSTQGPAWNVTGTSKEAEVANNKPVELKFQVQTPVDAALTKPYFSRPDIEQSYYDIENAQDLNQPLSPYPLAAWATLSYENQPIRLAQYVQTVRHVAGLGAVLDPLVVGPAVGVSISPSHGVVPLGAKSLQVTTVVHSNVKGPASGSVHLDLPSGWTAQPASAPFSTAQDGEDRDITFTITPGAFTEKPYTITAVAEYGNREYRQGYQTVSYPGLRPYFLYKPATYKTTGVDVTVAPGLKVAYVMGSGDDVPGSLQDLGIKVSFLSAADTAGANLGQFDTIVLGVRAYAARPELAAANNRLLEYVRNGGVLIVQYNTPEFDHNFGPYPYTMTNDPEEVTDEASKMDILLPATPVFNWPNRITEKDFAGWVEERGSKWMKSWDPHYQALLETHDPGQEPQKGGLLYAKYGKGIYIYNAYAFYRQLPEGVPGAYRLFANMLSLAKNPNR